MFWKAIDDILVHSSNKEHVGHLRIVLNEFYKQGITINSKKAVFFKPNIEFLGAEIGNDKIKLQPHINKKALDSKTPLPPQWFLVLLLLKWEGGI